MSAATFKSRLSPAFHRYPAESAVLGRLVVGFGELEYLTVVCAGRAIGTDKDRGIKALYRIRSTASRIDAAEAFIQPLFPKGDFEALCADAFQALRFCQRARNQYAHSNWADAEGYGLFFTALEDAAKDDTGMEFKWRHVDVVLLEQQEEYFVHTQSLLYRLEYAISLLLGKPIYPAPLAPAELKQPLLHNPPEKHVPPWLSEDQKALHLGRAQAGRGGPPTPTHGQQALDKARAQKRKRRDGERSRREHPPQK